MKFDLTINLGNILTIFGAVCSLWLFHIQNIKRLERISHKVDTMYNWFVKTIIEHRDPDHRRY